MHYLRLTPTLMAVLTLACPAQTTTTPPKPEPSGQRVDERRPEEPFTLDLLGQPVQLGGSWEYTDERRRNFDLDNTSARDRRVREHEIKLEARTRWGDHTQAFAQIVGLHETRRTQGTDGKLIRRSLERGQMWVQQDRIAGTPWSLQVGRIPLLDRRAWWWDEDIDAIRARYDAGAWRLDTGVAREVARKSSADKGIVPALRGVTRLFGQATWPWAQRHALDAFWLVQKDSSSQPASGTTFGGEDATDPSDLRARWVGLRAAGEWRLEDGPRLAYWADTAWLSGRERLTAFEEQNDGSFNAGPTTNQRVRGNAFDVGATGSLAWPLRPSLTVGYARGSAGFRQTGLQENKTRFAGVKRWQRYGELVQPELANLSVASVGAGVRVASNSSIELMAHRLRQVRASDRIAGSRLSTGPQGSDRAVGREVDLLLAVREWKQLEFTVKVSHFKPGAAFAPDQRNPARAVEVGISLNF
jgi:alginate production protein